MRGVLLSLSALNTALAVHAVTNGNSGLGFTFMITASILWAAGVLIK